MCFYKQSTKSAIVYLLRFYWGMYSMIKAVRRRNCLHICLHTYSRDIILSSCCRGCRTWQFFNNTKAMIATTVKIKIHSVVVVELSNNPIVLYPTYFYLNTLWIYGKKCIYVCNRTCGLKWKWDTVRKKFNEI